MHSVKKSKATPKQLKPQRKINKQPQFLRTPKRFFQTTTVPASSTSILSISLKTPFNVSKRFLKLNLTSITTPQSPPTAPTAKSTPTARQAAPLSESEDHDDQPEVYIPPTANDMIITPAAIKHLKHLNKNVVSPDPQFGLRITVDTGGCSGFQYIYNKVPLPNDISQDVIDALAFISPDFEAQQALSDPAQVTDQKLVAVDSELYFVRQQQFVVTDDVSMSFLKGSKLDFKTELIRSGFAVLANPNVDLACGCGTSFSRKEVSKNSV